MYDDKIGIRHFCNHISAGMLLAQMGLSGYRQCDWMLIISLLMTRVVF